MKPLLFALFAVSAFAQSLSAATITSITCSGQTATVNATAHGLIASQGFELTGTAAQFNGTAATVTTNAFTFTVATGTPCSTFTSGYTSVNPAVQVVALPAQANPTAGTTTLTYLYWFTTVYPSPLSAGTKSVWTGANAAQNAAIVAGTTVEFQGSTAFAASTSTSTVQSTILSQYQTEQVSFANFLFAFGCYNGTTWTTTCQ